MLIAIFVVCLCVIYPICCLCYVSYLAFTDVWFIFFFVISVLHSACVVCVQYTPGCRLSSLSFVLIFFFRSFVPNKSLSFVRINIPYCCLFVTQITSSIVCVCVINLIVIKQCVIYLICYLLYKSMPLFSLIVVCLC